MCVKILPFPNLRLNRCTNAYPCAVSSAPCPCVHSQFFPRTSTSRGYYDIFIFSHSLICQTQEKIPMKLANQFSLMPICNFTVAVANHSCYSRRIVRIVWQRDELVMWFETAFAMICMDYHLFICRRESTFAFSFRSFS